MQPLGAGVVPPVDVLITVTSLLAPLPGLRTLQLTNKSANDVWYAVKPDVPVVGSGGYLKRTPPALSTATVFPSQA